MVSGLDWKGLDLRCGLVIVLCSSAKPQSSSLHPGLYMLMGTGEFRKG